MPRLRGLTTVCGVLLLGLGGSCAFSSMLRAGPEAESADPSAVALPTSCFGYWIRAPEHDEGNGQVYRPRGYDLPPARGREALEIRADGSFVEHGIAPTDGLVTRAGRWEAVTFHRLAVRFDAVEVGGYILEIVELGPDKLVLRRIP